MKCFKFNMVEIALAVAVISIGLSAVLVLFPVGINATRAAMDENSCSDAAEYITRYIRARFLNEWFKDSQNCNFSALKIPSAYPSTAPSAWKSSAVTFKRKTDNQDITFSKLFEEKDCDGIFKFVNTGYDNEEIFSAVVKVWMPANDLTSAASSASSACPLYIPHTTDPEHPNKPKRVTGAADGIALHEADGTTPIPIGRFAQSVLVEISWPADALDADRTNKRVFRVDVYNPYYGIAP